MLVSKVLLSKFPNLCRYAAVLILPTAPGAAPKPDADPAANEAWRRKTLQLMSICSMCGFPQVWLWDCQSQTFV